MKKKICVYSICKNEEEHVDKWVDAHEEADLLIVTDTGSEDNTVEKLKNRGVIVHETKLDFFRFDEARNISLSNVPNDVDICVCTDLDEIFETGWRKKVEKAWKDGVSRLNYLCHLIYAENNVLIGKMTTSKIHSRKNYKWRWPVHEWLVYDGEEAEKIIFVEDLISKHYRYNKKSNEFYLNLLEFAVKEMPDDSRMRYYLGREYMYKNEWQKCIDTLLPYFSIENGPWSEEKSGAMRHIAKSYKFLSNKKECYKWFIKSMEETPNIRDPYIDLAFAAMEFEDFEISFLAFKLALNIKKIIPAFEGSTYCFSKNINESFFDLCNELDIPEEKFKKYDFNFQNI
ncbi:MAG: glycosyl transferase family 2 [Clostridiales bacterium]|nr:glycosyl transferase family 2 [Clostridiales bacterium]